MKQRRSILYIICLTLLVINLKASTAVASEDVMVDKINGEIAKEEVTTGNATTEETTSEEISNEETTKVDVTNKETDQAKTTIEEVTKEIVKEIAKEVANEVTKEIIKEVTKEVTNEVTKKATKEDTSKEDSTKKKGTAKDTSKKEKAEVAITISAAGDCTLSSDIKQPASVNFFSVYNKQKNDYFFQKVKPIFEQDDLTIVNFEGTLSNRGSRVQKQWAFRGKPSYINVIKEGSIEAVSFVLPPKQKLPRLYTM